jgi:DNA (cytosine-5)-methyltransferase 1
MGERESKQPATSHNGGLAPKTEGTGLRFIELFAGIGAFRLGLENTGHECVWANEWNLKARRIYERQFGDKPDGRDITTVPSGELPDADLIVGGFPCATFSVAGRRTGFSLEDTRGTLAFEMFRLAHERAIPYILFENVKGLLNHDGGRTFGIILSVLDGLGYDCQWELLDSQNFGVPQHRERIFVIANLRGKPRPKVFPIGITGGENDETHPQESGRRQGFFSNISPTLDAHYYKGGNARQYVVETESRRDEAMRVYDNGIVPTLTAQMGTGGNNVPYVRPNETETSYQLRKLTPLECERLQGLPDNFTKYYEDGTLVSDMVRYERCGRTITIPVVEAIGRKLHETY